MVSGFSRLVRKILLIFVGVMLSFNLQATISNGQVLVGAESFSQRLAAGIEYYVDGDGNLDIEQVKLLAQQGAFKTYLKDTLHFGYSEKVHWLRFSVHNQLPVASEEQRFFISIRYPFLDSIQLVRQRTEELEQANLRLEELNITDELTGLRNRRYLNQVFVAEYKRAFRERHTLDVLMLDIDNFKALNDTCGHLFGDICLSKAGDNILASINRATDIAVRYGGEEFVVVLPKTDEAGACKVAEDIRMLFESTPISGEGHTVTITVSVGVAVETPSHRENHERLLKRADELLYDAKTGGRNQVKMELVDLGDAEN